MFVICLLVADDSSSGSGTKTPMEERVHCSVADMILFPLKAHFNFCFLVLPVLASRESKNKVISTTKTNRNNKAADVYLLHPEEISTVAKPIPCCCGNVLCT